MPIHNTEIADIFNKVADLLEMGDENRFRIRAYRDAARTIEGLPENISDIVKEKKPLTELHGIGKDLAGKIETIVKTGKLPLLEELKQNAPPDFDKFMKIPSLGAKRIKALYDKLKIKSTEDLEWAAKKGKIRVLPGFGEKAEESILRGIERAEKMETDRLRLVDTEEIAAILIKYLKQDNGVKKIELAGSNRRKRETVRDLDILVTCRDAKRIMDRFVKYEDVERITSKGDARSGVFLRSGLQVDLRVVPEESYGAALLYFTGSKAHNIAIRRIAVKKKLKINEYGVFRGKKRVAGKTEDEMYRTIGLSYVEPELRENQGEIEAAKKGKLPRLVKLGDIKGDLHTHTELTDGENTLEEMARAAEKLGYEYIANTEHSKHVAVAGGIDEETLVARIKEIDKLNKKLKNVVILKAIEVDILKDGSLDFSDGILKELDFAIGAIHYRFDLPGDKQTERILKAIDNPYVNILAHPTGRLINERPPYDIDMERIVKAAKERGCVMELNSHPSRLDLNDLHCKLAKDIGAKIAISTDAHSAKDLAYMRFGICQARRGWLEAKDVINTRSLNELKRLFKRE